MLQQAVSFTIQDNTSKPTVSAQQEENIFGVDFSALANIQVSSSITPIEQAPPAKKPRTKKKANGDEVLLSEKSERGLSILETNEPYIDTFQEGISVLRTSVAQIDQLSIELKKEFDSVLHNRTMKGKYKIVTDLANTMAALVSTKVNATKEINKVNLDCHNLELKKVKDLKLTEKNTEVDDNAYIQSMYQAFIQTPLGTGGYSMPSPLTQTNDMTNIIRSTTAPTEQYDAGFANYMNNLTPSQNAMILEQNPDIETVVVYDQSTGQRKFEKMNMKTGQTVPNCPLPDDMFLADTTIDLQANIARNVNLNKTYPLVVVGGNQFNNQY